MGKIVSLVDELSQLAKTKKLVSERYSEVEAEILKLGEEDLKNSKEKSISYAGSDSNKVTFTKSESLKVVFPSLLKDIFGVLYDDVVEEKVTHTINAEGKAILINMWLGNYFSDSSVESIVKSLNVDDKTEKALLKKLKGKNAETDKKNLMTIAKLDEKTAEETAYFVSEVVAYQKFMAIVDANADEDGEVDITKILSNINNAVMVDEGVKIKVE